MGKACTVLAASRRAGTWARAYAERAGLSCRILESSSAQVLSAADLARTGGSFSVVIIDQAASGPGALAQVLQHAQRALIPDGQLWLLERYDALESAGERVVEHPLSRLRRLLRDAGLACERISPVEADGEHVLVALAGPAAAAKRGHGAGAA
jgi:hypothetical protein